MANHNSTTTTHRSSSTTSPPAPTPTEHVHARKTLYTLKFSWPFNIPSTPESAAERIIKNLARFSLLYAIFVWTVLFIALIPRRKVSIVYLVATTEVAFLYVLLLRAFPDLAAVISKLIDRRVVMFLLAVAVGVEMILTRAGLHFLVVLGASLPVIVLHAVLIKGEDQCVYVHVDEGGEMVRLVDDDDDGELGDDHQVDNLV